MLRRLTLQSARRLSCASSRLPAGFLGNKKPAFVVAWQQQAYFSTRNGSKYPPPSDDDDSPESVERSAMNSADDMEFFDPTAFELDEDEETEEEILEREKEEKRQKIRDELDKRTGRLWSDPWEITVDEWSTKRVADDLPDWTPELTSRISNERVKVHPDGLPTLSTIASIPLPPPPPVHPGHGNAKLYAKLRKSSHYDYVAEKVAAIAAPKIDAILKKESWQDKQDAVDELFESVEFELKDKEKILGRHPKFGGWVERALEEYLRSVKRDSSSSEDTASDTEIVEDSSDDISTMEQDEKALPIFCDLYDKEEGPDVVVPKILHPLKPHAKDGPGRMIEEWEIISHKETKRIMLRQSTRKIAQALANDSKPSRVYVTGKRGVGKTAALATIVASARRSGHIVMYMPDGDRLRKLGYYIVPSGHRKGTFDLPRLSQEVCAEILESHAEDMKEMVASTETLAKFMSESQITKLPVESKENITLVDLLNVAGEHENYAAPCYSVVVHELMNQTEKPFLMVADAFNCYFDHGQYFHMDYDENVNDAIPCKLINLFEPLIKTMGISADDESETESTTIKRGGIVVGTSEAHAVAREFTDGLDASARKASKEDSEMPLHFVQVSRFSSLEVEHIISNFEATGLGRLRFDRGDTVMNENEVAYIRMVSGGVGQNLVDECVMV
mmetsp:Transcript_15278/g.21288  ORF Transcript_15278/g.21288 Transcript_15278/m.21288 type:complete len:675 (+) Transcript_15278:72-2096(+)